MRMDWVTRLLLVVAVLVMAVTSVAVATGGDEAEAPSAETVADAPQGRLAAIDGCVRRRLSNEGQVKVAVPGFCVNGMCRINMLWKGEPMGALNQGFAWGADYVQFKRGWWAAGPAISIAGWGNPGDGLGRHGDGLPQQLFYGQTTDGSFISLSDDDPPFENGSGKFVFELGITNPGNPEIDYAEFWACALG